MADLAYGRVPITRAAEDLFVDALSASMGEDEIRRTVNLPNTGQATNLPDGAVLEATTLIGGAGDRPLSFGEVPLLLVDDPSAKRPAPTRG